MKPAIRVENLSKLYRIGVLRNDGYRTLREAIVDAAAGPWRRLRDRSSSSRRVLGDPQQPEGMIYALRDISFEIEPGEVVGIIGRNGAGKSTLLKILSRITEPTAGRAMLRGQVGTLLEVGTGFHPELTGRENIYLNGAVLGMRRAQIKRYFDAIVDFSGIEKFLDTPVKRYSSGMYVRLAFSVAAHLEPEVLVIDEVLAVGDQSFQNKCLGKMGEISRSGRTVLFVSHNIASIEALCDRCLLLDRGRLAFEGETREVLTRYHCQDIHRSSGQMDLSDHHRRTSGSRAIMTAVVLGDGMGEPVDRVRMGSQLSISVEFDSRDGPLSPVLGAVLKTGLGAALFGVNNRFIPGYEFDKQVRAGWITCRIDRLPLMPGLYSLDLYFGDDQRDLDVIHDAISFEVTPADVFGSGKIPSHHGGPFFWPATWELQ
jgi:lipopolysaccharide transport system ATP-binding protein